MLSSLGECRGYIFSLRSWLSLSLFHMHARRYASPPPCPSPPTVALGLERVGRTRSWFVRPVAVVAFKIGVTEFARVFQNRALSGGGGKPNLMLSSRMGGGGGVAADGPLAKGQPLSGFFALSATIHHWNSGLLRMESED